jgi:MoaA/NifB/PqqE/SkfB family radical SAM enzyme
MPLTLVVQPPMVIARDVEGHPWFADLGAAMAAAAFRAAGRDVAIVNAYALVGSTVAWRADGRARLGAPVDEVVEACRARVGGAGEVVVCCLSGARPQDGEADAVLAALRSIAPSAHVTARPWADEACAPGGAPLPAWDLVDLRARDTFCERVMDGLGRPWRFPIDGRTLPLSLPPASGADKLREHVVALVRAHGATRLHVLDDATELTASRLEALLDAIEHVDARFDIPGGVRADQIEAGWIRRLRGRVTKLRVTGDAAGGGAVAAASRTWVAEAAHAAGVSLALDFAVGARGESGTEVNESLALARDLAARFGAEPLVVWGPARGSLEAATLDRFRGTFEALMRASQGPRKVVMNVTYTCNNHCTFCAVGTRTQVHGNPERQREWLAHYRRRGVALVDFDGGEPTLDPNLLPLIQYARSLGYERIHVTTNGRLCYYEEYGRRLVRSGITSLLFSVHGADARTHAQQVGVAEAFEQTTGGIRHCVKHAPCGVELGMNVTLTKSNFESLPDLAELALSLGLPWLNVQFLTPFGRATKWVAPDTREAAAVTARVIDAYRHRMKLQVINLPFCFLPGYEEFLTGDLAKIERHMIFVNNETVNLAAYLAERRVHKEACGPCPHRVFCGGFYELDDVPEPPWLVSPEDLVRPISASRP